MQNANDNGENLVDSIVIGSTMANFTKVQHA